MSKLPAHGGDFTFFKKDILFDFSVNINPLGFPSGLKEYLFENFREIEKYPEPYAESLIKKLSLFYNCPESNILCGNGSAQFIYILPPALNIKKALIVVPNFSEYEKSIKAFGGGFIYFYLKEKNSFNLEISSLLDFLKKKLNKNYDAIFICNPSNPCGTFTPTDKLKEIVKFSQKFNKLLIIDEAFIDFTDDKGMINIKAKNLIILRSFTKNFGIPGLRLGICKTSSVISKKIKKFLSPWSVNSLSIYAGKFLIEKKDFLKKSKKFVNTEKTFFYNETNYINSLKYFKSDANYILFKILNESNAFELQKFLLNKGILIRNCANYRGLNNKFFRIGIKKHSENEILVKELKNFFKKGSCK